MVGQLIQFLIMVLIFGVIAYGLHWVCVQYGVPRPIMWIVGVILLIILLVFAANITGVGSMESIRFGR